VFLTLVLSAAVSVLLGLAGGGGSILMVPLLTYGARLDTRPAITTSLLAVGTSALAALVPHALAGKVRWKVGLLFGGAGIAGAHLGGRLSSRIPEALLLAGFGAMMAFTAIALFRCRRCDGDPSSPRTTSPAPHRIARLAALGFVVGLLTGLVGVGGGFLIVPALTILAGVPTRAAVATSLFVAALNSLSAFSGHILHVGHDPTLTVPLIAVSAIGGLTGSLLTDRIPQRTLRRALAVVVLVVAVFGAVTRCMASRTPRVPTPADAARVAERGRTEPADGQIRPDDSRMSW
jgi:uncharacterized membrane protein YfcA